MTLKKIMSYFFKVTIVFLFIASSNGHQFSYNTYLKVLGTVQDGGSPHIGCQKSCCTDLSSQEKEERKVTSLELYQHGSNKSFLFEATPDIISQWDLMNHPPSGIFLTHAHMGHYSGLLHLGKEALASESIPVYVMPRMYNFLKNNGPWSQLIDQKNILLKELHENESVQVLNKVKIIPLLVPHRDEFSETVGYKIVGPKKKVLFIPDINKWSLWNKNLISVLKDVDLAFLDATFFNAEEVNYRPISEIPHPLVHETIKYLENETKEIKNKVYFIHMNHTNPLLDPNSDSTKWVVKQGFNIARIGQEFEL